MPFKKADIVGAYTPEQLHMLQQAYDEVCNILGRCPTSDENKDVLARAVINIYKSGEKDPQKIAKLIFEIEEYLF